MADPGESKLSYFMIHNIKNIFFKEVSPRFYKYPQLLFDQMVALNLCEHDHSFVPPW